MQKYFDLLTVIAFFRAQWVTLLLGVLCVVPSYWATIRRVLPTIWFVQTFTLNLRWVWFWPCIDFYFDFQFYFGHFRRVLTSYIYRENFFWFCYDSLPRTRLLRQKVFTHQRLSVLCLSILFSSGTVIEASWGRIIQHLIPTKTSCIFCSIPVMVPDESDSLNLAPICFLVWIIKTASENPLKVWENKIQKLKKVASVASSSFCVNRDKLLQRIRVPRTQKNNQKVKHGILYIRVFHITPFFELSYTLLTTHAHGLYEVTKKFQRYRQ